MSEFLSCPLLVVGSFAAIVVLTEPQRLQVANPLTLMFFLAGIALNVASEGAAGLCGSLAGAALGCSGVLLFYLVGAVKAGEVKFMAAAGAWLGVPATAYVLGAAAALTVAYASLVQLRQRGFRRVIARLEVTLFLLAAIGRHLIADGRFEALGQPDDQRKQGVPFVAMVAAVVLAWVVWEALSV